MVVVVLLAEFDPVWRGVTLDEIRAAHPSELDKGQLLVIHVPPQFYPPLTGTDLLPQTTELHILGPLSNIEGAPDHRVTERGPQTTVSTLRDTSPLLSLTLPPAHLLLQP